MAEYDSWAKLYDLVHPGLADESDFYEHEALHCGGAVLELGCGTGRIAIPIAQQGVRVVGLDISSSMLDVCGQKWDEASAKVENTLNLVQGDMSDFSLEDTFSLVMMPYRSFMHLLDFKAQLSCLNCVAAHLEPDGRFIMNTWVPSAAYIYAFGSGQEELEVNLIETYSLDEAGMTLEHYHSVEYEEFEQRMVEEHLFVSKNAQGEEMERESLPLVRNWFTVREMNNLIAASALEIDCVWGSFDRTPLKAGDTEAIWVLRKSSE